MVDDVRLDTRLAAELIVLLTKTLNGKSIRTFWGLSNLPDYHGKVFVGL